MSLRFRVTIDGTDKVRNFVKLIESFKKFSKEQTIVTVSLDSITFYRSSTSVRPENMFEFKCLPNECFTSYQFDMANDDQTSSIAPTLSFSVSTPHLVEALMHQERAEVIKICIMQIGDTPVLRIRNPGTSAVQDIGIDFQYGNTDDYTIQPSIGESVTIAIAEAGTLNALLTALKRMENKSVTMIANRRKSELTFRARTTTEVGAFITLNDVSITHNPPPDGRGALNPDEMSVTVNLAILQKFCHVIPFPTQMIELQMVDRTALRLFVHRVEGIFTLYLCHVEIA